MKQPLILYSANSWLAYVISEQFYAHKHYVWCTPQFDSGSLARFDATTPPTSTPSEIYHSLEAEVRAGDRHSAKIEQNRVGILRGASIKRAAKVITPQQEKDIVAIVNSAQVQDFKPILYIIPYSLVAKSLKAVPIAKKAHPLSIEYVIKDLKREYFDIIELLRR